MELAFPYLQKKTIISVLSVRKYTNSMDGNAIPTHTHTYS